MGAFQFAGFSFGTVGANGGGDRPLDAPPINSFIVWRGNKVHSNGGFSIASDVDMTPGAELREGHQSTGAQPFTSEVLLEANTVQDSAVPFARGSGATAVGGMLLRGNSFADEVVDNDGSSRLPPLRSAIKPSTVLKGDDRGDTTQQVVDCYLRTDLDAAKCSKDGRFDLYQLVNNKTWAGPVVGINCCGGKGGTVVPGAPEPFGTGIPLARCEQACQNHGVILRTKGQSKREALI